MSDAGSAVEHRPWAEDADIAAVAVPVLVTDATAEDAPVTFANEAFRALTGFAADDLAGRPCRLLFDLDDDPAGTRLQEVLGGHRDATLDARLSCRNGGGRRVRVVVRTVADDAGCARRHVLTCISGEAQEAAVPAERRYRKLFDSIDEGFCVIEMIFDDGGLPVDYRFLEVNAAFERQTGLSEAVGRTIRSFQPDHEDHWFEIYGRIARSRRAERFEQPAARLGFYYDVFAFPVGEPSEAKVGILFRDVSERHGAEQSLRESEERFRLIVENARDYAIFTTDPDGRVTDWHAGAEAVFGYRRDEIVGRPAEILFTPEDRAAGAARDELTRARDEGRALNVRWHLRKDGGRVFIEGMATALRGADGSLRGILKIGQDVTERRAGEEALRESRRRQRALIEGIPQLVWRSAGGGEWTWSSPQWSAYTGLSEEQSRGDGWLQALHPEDRESAREAWVAAGCAGPLDMETRIYHATEGRYRWFRTRATAVRDDSGRVVEWLGTSTDIDDLRRLQDQQGVLVAELQHRTRNLIAVVQSLAEQTIRGSQTLEDFRTRFGGRLTALSRIQGLLSRAEMKPITIGDLVRMEVEALAAGELGDRLTIEGPDVPLRNAIVQTVSLALHELATNARKHGALSGDHGRLLVRWRVLESDSDTPHLAVEWREDGIEVRRPDERSRSGYGRKLIERALPYTLGARTEYHLGEGSLRCTIDLPLRPPVQPGE